MCVIVKLRDSVKVIVMLLFCLLWSHAVAHTLTACWYGFAVENRRGMLFSSPTIHHIFRFELFFCTCRIFFSGQTHTYLKTCDALSFLSFKSSLDFVVLCFGVFGDFSTSQSYISHTFSFIY